MKQIRKTDLTKRPYRTKPKPAHKTALMKMMRGVEPKQALVESGLHSPLSAVVKTQSFQELLEEKLPDEKLITVHRDGLDAVKYIGADLKEAPDHLVRKQFLELAYKLRGKITPDGPPGNTININLFTPDQLKRVAARVIGDDASQSEESPD